jgi:NADH-quinone oxidoreductase subunit M
VNIPITVVASVGLVAAAIYALIAMQKVFQGMPTPGRGLKDLEAREVTVMVLMMIGLVWLGLYPQPVFELVNPVLASLYEFSGAGDTMRAWTGGGP